MASIPPATTLLQATADYLENDLLPTLDGFHRFQTRIAANVLRTVLREQMQQPSFAATEQQRLVELLGHDGELQALRRELAQGIEHGSIALDAPGLADHLRQTLADALAINNPKWIAARPEDRQGR
jgi:hypothetical protein